MRICVLSYKDFEVLDPGFVFNGYQWEMADLIAPVVGSIH